MSAPLKAKRKCCASRPRCKRCPVVLRRLEKAGLATREGKHTYVLRAGSAAKLKGARAR